jgi:hypothetical protein
MPISLGIVGRPNDRMMLGRVLSTVLARANAELAAG